jgi:uncharacterized cupredoxin-like copper-binding protein/Cu/Ag efflux protein CusF
MHIKFAYAIAAAALSSTLALAHGDEDHAAPRKYDASRVEPTDFGQQGNPEKVTKIIKVDMSDNMRFTPSVITVKRGDTVKFVVHNGGMVLHEMVLGTKQAIKEHAELMKKFPGMEHADANMAHVKPQANGEIVWQFTQAGEFQFACLQPGHFEAGMVGKVTVTPGARAETAPPGRVFQVAQISSAGAAATDGEVRKIDKEQGKVTMKHGPIANLEMPGMTMVFKVADPKMLDAIKEGDKVKFSADRVNGAITVTAIEVSN